MATIFKFRRYTSDTALLSGTLKLSADALGISSSKQGETITETFQLIAKTTVSTMITAAVGIDALADWAQKWMDDVLRDGEVWFHVAADGESEKRALVYSIDVQHAKRGGDGSLIEYGMLIMTVAVEHGPWESTGAAGSTSANDVSAWGGIIDGTADQDGSLDGRPHKVTVSGRSGGGGPMTEFWLGVRSEYDSITGFDPVMELEDGTAGTDTALGSESGASPQGSSTNNKMVTTFSTTSLAKRVSIRLDQAFPSSYSAYIGEYAMLLRCKVSSGSTIGVQARTGLKDSPVFAPNEEIYNITNTSYMLHNVGVISIPPIGFRADERDANYYAVRKATVQIWAEVITTNGGTDVIHLDAICLIPLRHMIYVDGAAIQYTTTPDNVKLFRFANDKQQAVSYVSGVPSANVEARFGNWITPCDIGMVVFAAQRASSHVLTDAVDIEYLFRSRWRTFRG